MPITATAKAPLGASTTNRKWYLDVNTGTAAAPLWKGVFGVTEFQAKVEGSLQDDSDFDGNGWKSSTNSANAWSIELKVKRAVTAALATAYDPGQEVLRIASDKTGVANSVPVRWYEMEAGGPKVEAYAGTAAVTYSEDGGNMEALSMASITLTGQGARAVIVHPNVV